MRKAFYYFVLLLAFCLTLQPTWAAEKESAFNRVMRTNTLRCGYVALPPQFIIDPKTGQFSGVSYDVVTEIAKRLHLKVEWTEQVNFATVGEGIKSGRYDAFCLTGYRWPNLARVFDYTDPVFYSTTNAYVRKNDHRFDRDLKTINDDKVTVATIDGEASEAIRNDDFPRAKIYSMPQDTAISMLLEAVDSGKADVALANPLMVMPYLQAKPDTIRRIEGHNPIRAYAHALAFGKGEQEMASTFNVALEEMLNSGVIDQILDRYEKIPHSFVRVKSPVRN